MSWKKKKELVEQPLLRKSGQYPRVTALPQSLGSGRTWDQLLLGAEPKERRVRRRRGVVPAAFSSAGAHLPRPNLLCRVDWRRCRLRVCHSSDLGCCKRVSVQQRRGGRKHSATGLLPSRVSVRTPRRSSVFASPASVEAGAAPISLGLMVPRSRSLCIGQSNAKLQRVPLGAPGPAGLVGSRWIHARELSEGEQKEESGERFLTPRSLPAPIQYPGTLRTTQGVWVTVNVLWWSMDSLHSFSQEVYSARVPCILAFVASQSFTNLEVLS